MNVDFKTHQLVVAGMQTQIKLLTTRCIEWQQHLSEAKANASRNAEALDKACATLAAVQIVAQGGQVPASADLPEMAVIEDCTVLQAVRQLRADYAAIEQFNEQLCDRAASMTEQHAAEIKAIKDRRARKNARARSRK